MNPLTILARRVGAHTVPRIAGVAVTALLLVAGGISAVVVAQQGPDWAEGIQERIQSIKEAADGDRDGLADALENRIGSDPDDSDTLGGGVLDGWLYHWYGESMEWDDPAFLDVHVMTPPTQELPEALRAPGAILPPTVAELYALDHDWRDPTGGKVAWWKDGALDPLQWDNRGDGVADAWLVQHGVDPLTVDLDDPAGDPSMTVREKYLLGLDPSTPDSDGDGLSDSAEIEGVARFGGRTLRFDPTDPLRFSSRGDPIADGYLVRFGLDPHDEDVDETSPAGDGITVREAFEVTRDHCLVAEPGGCDWLQRLQDGPLLDPTTWDSLGDGVPDAWSMRDPHGRAHPLQNATETAAYTTKEWDGQAWGGSPDDLSGVVVDDLNPAPEEFRLTFHDLYTYQRPEAWDEARDGPWWGGLPTVIDTPEGGLPPAVAMRGWDLQVDPVLGREAGKEPEPGQVQTIHVSADPRKADTDADGLTDQEEYFGVARGRVLVRTNPADPDTDADGLTDCQELLHSVRHECEDPAFEGEPDGGLRTDALRRDTSGSFLADGQEFAYWTQREQTALAAGGTDPVSGLPAETLGPLGNINGRTVDGEPVPNILDRDSDGDDLPDGAEVDPNRFLPQAAGIVRPTTDPAVADTDRDDLPDAWEVRWSPDRIFGCGPPCSLPSGTKTAAGWPLHPGLRLSLASSIEGGELAPGLTDLGVNLANDRAVGPDGQIQEFSNGIAHQYDLDPFDDMTDPADGIPDMFAIVWGVDNVPDFAQTTWTKAKADDLAGELAARQVKLDASHVVINPRHADQPGQPHAVTKDSNLLGMFGASPRNKGTWVFTSAESGSSGCQYTLPSSGLFAEAGVPADPAAPTVRLADRAQLPALDEESGFCWKWMDYPLHMDMAHSTNPWRHDTSGNGLPDAWEAYYNAASPSTRLRVASCDTTLVQGEVSIENCLTYLEMYQRGLDPTLERGDTDRGGVPDWLEVELGLDPLNQADDSPEQDWSGNGLPNIVELRLGLDPLSPDTDRDGLIDGGVLDRAVFDGLLEDDADPRTLLTFLQDTFGKGDLCLPGPGHSDFESNTLIPNMDKRPAILTEPAGGQLGYQQLYTWYVEQGILHDLQPGGRCPEHHVLFKREAVQLSDGSWWGAGRDLGTGVPQGSVSLKRDTSGDGVPDGWLVHWRDHSTDSAMDGPLSPGRDTRTEAYWDPEGDLLITPQEHGGPAVSIDGPPPWAAPADWDEDRDGVWWGGMDPASDDSAGNSEWFRTSRADGFYCQNPGCGNSGLADLDNDGIPDRYDLYPSFDHDNLGIVQWSETKGRFVTDYPALWSALDARSGSSFLDGDDDRIPDFLDRARIVVDDLEVPSGTLTKGEPASPPVVTGSVLVDEPETDDHGAPVGNVAVKVFVRDHKGMEALAGVGFTGSDGSFAVPVRVDGSIPVASCPSQATVAGRLCDPSNPPSLASNGLSLQPGDLDVRVEVEANDPTLQPLTFDGGTGPVDAHKSTEDAPFLLPDGLGPSTGSELAFIAVNDAGDAPSETLREEVQHTAAAVFPTSSSVQEGFRLRTQTVLTITDAADVVLGDTLLVNGTFLDQVADVPLAGHTVLVCLVGTSLCDDPETDDEGGFQALLETSTLQPGSYSVTAVVDLPSDSHLEAPEEATDTVQIFRETTWSDVVLNTTSLQDGSEYLYPAGDRIRVQARLLDHRGHPVGGKAVTASVTNATGTVLGPHGTTTATSSGLVDVDLGALPAGIPLEDLDLVLRQDSTATDEGDPLRIILKPVYNTTIEGLDEVVVDVGRPAVVEGRIVRTDGRPVFDPEGQILVRHGAQTLTINGTDAAGGFQFSTRRDVPFHAVWSVTYEPGTEQLLSADAQVSTRHVTSTRIEAVAPSALQDAPVEVEGRLVRADGTPVQGSLLATWDNQTFTTETDAGTFGFVLPERDVGTHPVLLQFNGSLVEKPADLVLDVAVQDRTNMTMRAQNVTFHGQAASPDRFVEGRLFSSNGTALGQRPVLVHLSGPNGSTLSINRFTALDGTFHVAPSDVESLAPGSWSVRAQYGGDLLEAPVGVEDVLTVYHVVALNLTRTPDEAWSGQQVTLHGSVGATPGGFLDPVHVRVLLDDRLVAETVAAPGGRWQVQFNASDVAPGIKTINASAQSPQEYVEVFSDEVLINFVSGATAELEEEGTNDRNVHVKVYEVGSGKPLPGLQVVLLRSVDGMPVQTYNVTTDAQGHGILRLPVGTEGNMSVVTLLDPVYRLDAQAASLGFVAPPLPGTPAWMYWVGGAALVVGLALAAAFVIWRNRQRHALAAAIEEARRLLIDPGASPARVIEAVYEHLLRILADAGDTISDEDTVRDIAHRATQALRLPREPMHIMSRLFELAKYSDQELSSQDRGAAIQALRYLAQSLGTQVRVERGEFLDS